MKPKATEAPPEPSRQLPAPLRGIRAAFVFLSRLPLGGFPYREADWAWSAAHFPLVGAVVGALSAGTYWLTSSLGPSLAATLALTASVLATGAFHEDGLADSADAMGAEGNRQRALEIMKDSHLGSYGATALVLSLLARAAAIASVAPSAGYAFVWVHAAARVPPVWLMLSQKHVGCAARSRHPARNSTRPVHLAVALCWLLVLGAAGVGLGGLPLRAFVMGVGFLVVLAALLGRYFRRRFGGITGDLLGATEQLSEIAAWTCCAAALHPTA